MRFLPLTWWRAGFPVIFWRTPTASHSPSLWRGKIQTVHLHQKNSLTPMDVRQLTSHYFFIGLYVNLWHQYELKLCRVDWISFSSWFTKNILKHLYVVYHVLTLIYSSLYDSYSLSFLVIVMRGFMTQRGMPDNPRSARYILKDFVNGKLLYAHAPPSVPQAEYHTHTVFQVIHSKESHV